MTEIDLVQSFRAGVAGPSPTARLAARARLVAAIPAETSTPPARSRARLPRRVAVAAGLAGALAALALAVGVLDSGGASVLERAQAAVEPNGRILHVVVRIVDDGVTTRGESWVPADGSSGRSIERTDGSTTECISTETQLRCFDAERNVVDVYRYNPGAVAKGGGLADLPQFRIDRPESLSRALGSGYAKLAGEATVDGRPVFEVLLAVPWVEEVGTITPVFNETSPTLYVDRETYFPVAQRFPDAGSITHYETFEFLPDDAAHRKLLVLSAPADARVVVHPVGEGPQS
jgi:hypothetical protein